MRAQAHLPVHTALELRKVRIWKTGFDRWVLDVGWRAGVGVLEEGGMEWMGEWVTGWVGYWVD